MEGAEKIVSFSKFTTLQLNGKPLSINWSDREKITNTTTIASYRRKMAEESDITQDKVLPKNMLKPGTIIFVRITDIKFLPNLNEIYTIFQR